MPTGPRPVSGCCSWRVKLEPGEEVEVEYLRDGTAASATVEPRPAWMAMGFDADRVEEVMDEVRARMEEVRERSQEAGERAREMAEQMREQWDDYAWFPEGGSAIAVMGLRASHGISLVTLNPQLGRYFNTEAGALVTEADEDNPLGLEGGDVVLAIDGRTIDSAGGRAPHPALLRGGRGHDAHDHARWRRDAGERLGGGSGAPAAGRGRARGARRPAGAKDVGPAQRPRARRVVADVEPRQAALEGHEPVGLQRGGGAARGGSAPGAEAFRRRLHLCARGPLSNL